MARSSKSPFKVALLWRGNRQARLDARPEGSRLGAIFASLARCGVEAEPAVYSEDMTGDVRDQLRRMDGVLVWVDPISEGQRRDALDELLREVSSSGVFVSTHPDVIGKMGVKAVLYWTKALGWGTDTHFYETPEDFAAEFPQRLAQSGPRVLKQNRGNGGIGVWKVTAKSDGTAEILSARGEELPRTLLLADFLTERREDSWAAVWSIKRSRRATWTEWSVAICPASGWRGLDTSWSGPWRIAQRDRPGRASILVRTMSAFSACAPLWRTTGRLAWQTAWGLSWQTCQLSGTPTSCWARRAPTAKTRTCSARSMSARCSRSRTRRPMHLRKP